MDSHVQVRTRMVSFGSSSGFGFGEEKMNQLKVFGFVLLAAALSGRTALAGQAPTFDLGLTNCQNLSGRPGTMGSQEVVATLSTSANPSATDGAQGWSISLSSEGASIDAVTTSQTAGAPVADGGFQNGGFEKTELTATGPNPASCPGMRDGAVSAIVLSFTLPITLPAVDNTQNILRLTVGCTFPDEGTSTPARVFFVDGCRGSGQPVGNRVTWMGNTIIPSLGECSFECRGVIPRICPDPDADLQVVIQSENTNHVVGDPFATGTPPGLAPTPDPLLPAEVEAAPGQATVYGGIVSQLSGQGIGGVQGWSLALSVKGDIELVGVSTAGTAAAPVPAGLQNGGFEKTETVNPNLDPATGMPAADPSLAQGPGAVTAIVLSFTLPITLAEDSTATVLCVTVQGDLGDTGQVCWRDGMRGSGQPVRNVATVNGETQQYSCCQAANVTFAEPPISDFIRCDPNNDLQNDIADAVWILNELFRGGPPTACPASADCDNNGQEDVTDALFAVNYNFRGGSAPSAPFPGCGGADLLMSPEQCPAGSTLCP
jgi:hypothetical protein